MPRTTRCPNPECGHRSIVQEEHIGRGVRCAKCGQAFVVRPSIDGQPSPAPASSGAEAPTAIGRYQVRARLGAGAFGTVYRAYDPQLDREVALKLLRPEALSSPKAVERFRREARAAARLIHANIIPVFDAGADGDSHFIASALIEGRTLADLIPDGGMEPRRAVRLTVQLLDALGHAHEQNILHRDVKPANILIDANDRLYLTDFGLAGFVAQNASRMTRMGAVLGTPAYMSPEQAAGVPTDHGPAADQYSAAVVLYELLTGEVPFEGPTEIVLFNILNGQLQPPSTLRPGLDSRLEAMCLKAMAKKPGERHADVATFGAALRGWLEEQDATVMDHPPPGRHSPVVRERTPDGSPKATNRREAGKGNRGSQLPDLTEVGSADPGQQTPQQVPAQPRRRTDVATQNSPWGDLADATVQPQRNKRNRQDSRALSLLVQLGISAALAAVVCLVYVLASFSGAEKETTKIIRSQPTAPPLEEKKPPPEKDGEKTVQQNSSASLAAAFQAGRFLAPNLSNATSLLNDNFTTPTPFLPNWKFASAEGGYRNGVYFMRDTETGRTWDYGKTNFSEMACELTGRLAEPTNYSWGLGIAIWTPDKEKEVGWSHKGAQVVLTRNREVLVGPFGWDPDQAGVLWRRTITHPAIKPADQFNALLLVVRGRLLEVYVNGVAVCPPITMDRDCTPGRIHLIGQKGPKELHVEFQSLRVWSAKGLPTLQESLDRFPKS